jgi:hypothetical protein
LFWTVALLPAKSLGATNKKGQRLIILASPKLRSFFLHTFAFGKMIDDAEWRSRVLYVSL